MKFVEALQRCSVEAVKPAGRPFRFNVSSLQCFNAKEK
jgi:hypothetical protein